MTIWGQYSMSYADGLNTRQFIKMLRRFSSSFIEGASSACDNEGGESEERKATADQRAQPQRVEGSNVVLHPRARNAIIAPHDGHLITRLIKTISGKMARWFGSHSRRALTQV
jgi:hypothetical protein